MPIWTIGIHCNITHQNNARISIFQISNVNQVKGRDHDVHDSPSKIRVDKSKELQNWSDVQLSDHKESTEDDVVAANDYPLHISRGEPGREEESQYPHCNRDESKYEIH